MNMSDDVVREAEKIGEEGYSARTLTGFTYRLFLCIGLVMALFHIYFLGYSSLEPWILYYTHLGFGLALAYLLYPFSAKSNASRPGAADIGLIVLSVAACAYFIISMNEIVFRIGVSPTPLDLVFSSLVILLVLEMTRRTNGFVLPLIAVLFILYGLYGNILTYSFGGHRGYSFSRLISYLVGMDAMLSTPLATAASFVFLFFLFSSFLASTGAGQFFIDLALGLAGGTRGGPAKVAVVASALEGMVSGSSVANTVGSGSITIPMMKKTGYKPEFAAAVEAVASTGGQFAPPIMGAVGFIMAEFLGVPYTKVMLAAAIPAFLYYLTLLMAVHFEARKLGLKGLSPEHIPAAGKVLRERGHLFIPLIVLLWLMFDGYTPLFAAAASIFATVGATWLPSLIGLLRTKTARTFAFVLLLAVLGGLALSGLLSLGAAILTALCVLASAWCSARYRMTPRVVVQALDEGARGAVGVGAACVIIGIIIGTVSLTGLGLTFGYEVLKYVGEGQLYLGGLFVMIMSTILGMGVPGVAAYVIVAAVAVPVLTGVGVMPMAAHMFCLFYACLSNITPPVAMSSYVAAGIAHSDQTRTSLIAVKLGLTGFILPFFFLNNPLLLYSSANPALATLWAFATACLGVSALAAGLQGWLFGPCNSVMRGLLLVAAFLAIDPGLKTDLAALALCAVAGVWSWKERGKG